MPRIDTIIEIVGLLENTLLAGSKVIDLEIPGSIDRALAIEINPENGIAAWKLMRSLLDRTKRYPVIVDSCEYPSTSKDWETSMRRSDLFRRSDYEEEVKGEEDTSTDPESIIARSMMFDIDTCIRDDANNFWEPFDDEERDEFLQGKLDDIQEYFGDAPALEQVRQIVIAYGAFNEINLERWLFQWELDNFGDRETIDLEDKIDQHDWFWPHGHIALILLPTEYGWQTPAYMYWDAYAGGIGGIPAITFLKRWYEKYQAELVCFHGTIIDIKVNKVPQTYQEAFALAVEHYTFSNYEITQGYSLRGYARQLMERYPWRFHERP
jgi:hypothetical protein